MSCVRIPLEGDPLPWDPRRGPHKLTMPFMKVKAVMVGAPKVGKTTIVRAWKGLPVCRPYKPTDIVEVSQLYRQYMDDAYLELHDVAGNVTEEQAAAILHEAHGVVMMYKYRDQPSIEMLDKVWLRWIRAYCRKDVYCFFAANQDDYMQPSYFYRPLTPNEKHVYKKLPLFNNLKLHFYTLESLEEYAEIQLSRVFEFSWHSYCTRMRGEFKWCHFL